MSGKKAKKEIELKMQTNKTVQSRTVSKASVLFSAGLDAIVLCDDKNFCRLFQYTLNYELGMMLVMTRELNF